MRKAINIMWNVDMNEVYEILDNMTCENAASSLEIPIEHYSNMTTLERYDYVNDTFRHCPALLDEFMNLPYEILIPDELEDEDISDWLSDEYGFCHNGFELVYYSEWIKTDDLQWRKQLTKTSYHLVEVRENPNGYVVVTGIFDIEDYDDEEIKSYITGYGYSSLKNIEEIYKDEVNGIIVECIFECISEMELTGFGVFKTEEDAEKYAEEYISKQLS